MLSKICKNLKMIKFIKVFQSYDNKNFILSNLNCTFQKKKYVLIGESGSGKSTFLHIAGNILKPSKGKVESSFNVSFIFQNSFFLEDFNLEENIDIACKINNIEPNWQHFAEYLKIDNLLKKYANEISGGQKQKMAILRALALKKEFILADEPSASLDRENADSIISLFNDLHEKFDIGFIISTHDTNWKSIADEILEIKNLNRKEKQC